jgi:hypothetical protein
VSKKEGERKRKRRSNLGLRRKVAVDVVDLVHESAVEELVGLIKNEHLDVPRPQVAALDHVENTSRGSRNELLTVLELADVLTDRRSTDAGVARDVHVVSEGEDDRLDLGSEFAGGGEDEGLGLADGGVDGLEHGDGESGGFTGTGLSLQEYEVSFGRERWKGKQRTWAITSRPLMTGAMARC